MNSLPNYTDVYKIVCHHCGQSHERVFKDGLYLLRPKTLHNIRDDFGFKTQNYACREHKDFMSKPLNEDASRVLVKQAKPQTWNKRHASSVTPL